MSRLPQAVATVQVDNERVRVTEWRFAPGAETGEHVHQMDYVVVPLGDGRLNYRPETIAEAYYRLQIGPWLQVSPDIQAIANPGYNRDRGPARVFSVRLNAKY